LTFVKDRCKINAELNSHAEKPHMCGRSHLQQKRDIMRPLRTVTWSVALLVGIFVVALGAGWPSEAGAQVILANPALPPEPDPPDCESLVSLYAANGVYATYPGPISMSYPRHKCFQNVVRQVVGSDEHETFDSVLDAKMDMGLGPVAATLTGPVDVIVFGKVGNTTGTFDTEMISMSLSGSVGGSNIQIRESPTWESLGQTTITDLGGGLYQIDSFFDIVTELSVDGGQWMTQVNQAMRIVLVAAATVPVQHTTWGAIKALYH
jgi:hypothetical protein